MNDVTQRIENIKSIFLDTQLFYAKQPCMDVLINYLEEADPSYRSVAYESASMSIALEDLEDGTLDTWLRFANNHAATHQAQVYIGLGWAISKLTIPFSPFVEQVENQFYHRVADGCGYYDGSFKQRQAVLSQQLPANLPEAAMPFYDQGLGRSLWYTCNADIDKVRSRIESFPADRQAHLWRGIGIAVAYVGGCDDNTLKMLMQYAATNRVQLAYGAALAARSRMEANTMTNDTDHCSRLWFGLMADELNIFPSIAADLVDNNNASVYLNWITQIEEGLANSFELKI